MDKKIYDKTDQFFGSYTSSESNNRCFDCNSAAPQWASITHGILICFVCTSEHRQLGTTISQVRSINLDIWTEKHIAMMKVGGNQQFKEFLEKYNLETEKPKIKYMTRAANFYRRKLASMANNTVFSEEDPDYDEGRLMTDGSQVPTRSPQDAANTQDQIEEELKDIDVQMMDNQTNGGEQQTQEGQQKSSTANQYFSAFKSKAGSLFDKVASSNVIQKASTSAKEMYQKAGTVAKETGTKVKTKFDESGVTNVASQTAGKIATGGKFVGGYIVDKAKVAKNAVGEKIDNNPKLSSATQVAKEKVGVIGNAISGMFGKFKTQKKDQQPLAYEEIQQQNNIGNDSTQNSSEINSNNKEQEFELHDEKDDQPYENAKEDDQNKIRI